jgi:hypothetical protein
VTRSNCHGPGLVLIHIFLGLVYIYMILVLYISFLVHIKQ